MTDLPLHPTLFLSLAIMTGFMIAPLLAYTDKKSPIENSVSNTNFLLSSTWFLAAAFSVGLFMVYISSPSNEAFEMAKALAPLGMMVAALIASASVMKNIAETKAHDIAKSEKEKARKRLFALNTIETMDSVLSSLEDDIANYRTDNSIDDEFLPYIETLKKLLDLVFTERIIQFLDDEERKIVTKLYRNFYLFYSVYEHQSKTKEDFDSMKPIKRLLALTVDFKSIIEEYLKISKDK